MIFQIYQQLEKYNKIQTTPDVFWKGVYLEYVNLGRTHCFITHSLHTRAICFDLVRFIYQLLGICVFTYFDILRFTYGYILRSKAEILQDISFMLSFIIHLARSTQLHIIHKSTICILMNEMCS